MPGRSPRNRSLGSERIVAETRHDDVVAAVRRAARALEGVDLEIGVRHAKGHPAVLALVEIPPGADLEFHRLLDIAARDRGTARGRERASGAADVGIAGIAIAEMRRAGGVVETVSVGVLDAPVAVEIPCRRGMRRDAD